MWERARREAGPFLLQCIEVLPTQWKRRPTEIHLGPNPRDPLLMVSGARWTTIDARWTQVDGRWTERNCRCISTERPMHLIGLAMD
jgi:hypothetical protein